MRPASRCRMALISAFIGSTSVSAYDLDRHAWRDRLLVLAAPSAQHPGLGAQAQALSSRRAALEDRRLRVFILTGDTGSLDGKPLAANDVETLRRAFDIPRDETALLLIGLDGGVKRRASLDTALSELFLQIDGMPMRRAELRARHAAGETVTEP